MTKELQDLAWSLLPKEFKEEVKKYYCTLQEQYKDYDGLHFQNAKAKVQERIVTVEYFFGKHNLTSDTEGEEMLIVSRKRVQELYSEMQKIVPASEYDRGFRNAERATLYHLFGSKCLPDEKDDCQKFTKMLDDTLEGDIKEPFKEWRDENYSNVEKLEKNGEVEPKPAEPKFKVGDKVRYKEFVGTVYQIEETDYVIRNLAGGDLIGWLKESDLEPYTEPKENLCMDYEGFYRKETDEHGNKVKVRIPSGEAEPYTEPREEVSKMKPIESKVSVYLATEEETKIHNIYPDKTVTYSGYRTPNFLTFSEFKKQYFEENINLSQETVNCDKEFDNILKDSLSKERRLNIAAMVMQGIMANPNPQMVEMDAHRVADLAILMADTLIAECEKGGQK